MFANLCLRLSRWARWLSRSLLAREPPGFLQTALSGLRSVKTAQQGDTQSVDAVSQHLGRL